MISASLGRFDVTWDAGTISVTPGLDAELSADSPTARAGLAAAALKLQADVEPRFHAPAYDPDAFESDRPFRVAPGSTEHARLVFRALGAEIEFDTTEFDAEEADLLADLEELWL